MKLLLIPYIFVGFFVGGILAEIGRNPIKDGDKEFAIYSHVFLVVLYLIVLWQVFKTKRFLGADKVFGLYGLPATYLLSAVIAFIYFKYS